jgi:hypothetical protein
LLVPSITSRSPIVEVMSISICEKTTTLIILEVQLVLHFIEGIDIDTADTTSLVLLMYTAADIYKTAH